ncbi:TetR family transcriptional regulator [soil metagenome]
MRDVAEPGLRERKRLATRRAIQVAALRLVHERGLDNVTVDEISRAADVAPRTFFNYFCSKEEALVGEGPRHPSEEAVETFVTDRGDLLQAIGTLMTDAAADALGDSEIVQLRKPLATDYPDLTVLRMQTFRAFEQQLVEIVARRLAAQDPQLAADSIRLESRAQLVTLVAVAAMHHAWKSWAGNPSAPQTLAERLSESFAELEDALGVLAPS